jgi:hypothetical protein
MTNKMNPEYLHRNQIRPKRQRLDTYHLGSAWGESGNEIDVGSATLNHSAILVVGGPACSDLEVPVDKFHVDGENHLIVLGALDGCRLPLNLAS